jgi:hypothetical protein
VRLKNHASEKIDEPARPSAASHPQLAHPAPAVQPSQVTGLLREEPGGTMDIVTQDLLDKGINQAAVTRERALSRAKTSSCRA